MSQWLPGVSGNACYVISMKDFTAVSDGFLHSNTLSAASNEKEATYLLLEYLAEVDRRRLYATLAYSSLWEYTHKALGYSEAQASERVNAMRVMIRVPEVREQLATGKLTLTSTAKLAVHARRENLEPAETASLLSQISGKTSREVERVLSSRSSSPQKPDRARAITPDLTRITIEVDEEFLGLVAQVKAFKGNPALSYQEAFEAGMRELLRKREIKTVARAPEVKPIPKNETSKKSRYIAMNIRHKIRSRSGDRCEFADPETGRRCESKTGLEFDHIQPYSKGGTSTEENLRHLCRCHNTLAAILEFGSDKMRPYLKL